MRKEINNIHFHYLTKRFHFPNRTQLKSFLQKLAKREGYAIDTINYIFCDDEYLLSINQQYLNHDTYTDIITFQLNPKGEDLLSDVYISVERVKENAQLHNTSFTQELHRVVFHGLLHLCGYKDKTKKDQEEMRKQENRCLNNYFVPRGTK
jgi:probable rRNA maturation factor